MRVVKFERKLSLLLAAVPLLIVILNVSAAEEVWESSNGSFKVSYRSKVMPIPINQIHQWVLLIENAKGEPVSDANVELQGAMPLHDHGLPTNPVVTEYLGEGNYLIEGIRFHMMGGWEITLEISQDCHRETVLIPLRI
ncbi:MAG: FixH family protein [Pseudohongiellaceae bacterium]